MSTLLNKSNHPVLIKKIPISAWSLRAEIEACIKEKIKNNGGNIEGLDITDIQEFYSDLKTYDDLPNEEDEDEDDHVDGDLDPSGNPMDDDAKAMMEAMGGGADSEDSDEESPNEESSEDEATEDEATEDKAEDSEEDAAAAALAAEMLGDQGGASSDEDDAAAALAAEMLGDQGGNESADTKESTPATKVDTKFKRTFPKKSERNHGFLFLSDINMEQALIFTREKYTTGSNIVIELNVPKKFTLTAEVMTSFAVNRNSRVISDTKPNYRLQCKLHFSFEGERTNLRDFLKQVEPDVPPPPSKLKKPVTQDEDEDEFDDLGF
tara:strand:+ start:92937 stop:93905 length:969 start_codon:yes stop_codon:yes gene_type:complete